jgi:hypothetical protein
MTNNISLGQVRVENRFNLKSLYEMSDEVNINDEHDSPFQQFGNDCDYCEPNNFRELPKFTLNSVSYFHLNCRSLSSNWESFYDLICDLHDENFSFDYIGVSEVFKCDKDLRLALPGFHKLITRSRNDDNHGGVGLFVKQNVQFKIREDLSIFIPHVFESIFIEVLSNTNKNTIVGVIYRPNTQPKADMDIFTSTLFDLMNIINVEKKKSTIMGDFNIDLLKYNSHDKTNNYVDNLFTQGFLPLITKPTRVTSTSATLIDHIYTNNICKASISGIILTDVADHFGIFYCVQCKPTQSKNAIIKKRSFSERNVKLFKSYLDEMNFTQILQINCPNEAYNNFIVMYKEAFEKAFPLLDKRPNSKYTKREPWMTTGLLTSSRTKSKLFVKKLQKPTMHNIATYKNYINQFNKLKKIIKRDYFKCMLDMNKHNMKKTWQILKKAIGKQSDKSSFPQSFKIDNENISNKMQIAESFNTYFANIGASTSQNVPKLKKHYTDYLANSVCNSMYLESIDPSVVFDVVKKLKPKTSSGHDEISTKLVKESIVTIIQPLTHIINLSLNTGIVPDQLKIAKVIPIYKSSDTNQLKNYRPISLLPAFSKILEKIMFNKLMSFLDSQNILYKHQYGFRPKHSTIHPILHLLNKCAENNNIQPKKYTMSIFCDLSKAFDVISHKILIKKLDHYGIRGIAQKWLVSYLSDRSQFVEIDNNKSPVLKIECGVPQGSILGTLLYLIYVNDIAKSCNENILSFADDTSLYLSDSNIDNLFSNANIQLNKLYEWFCANRLSLNPNKTKFIILKTPNSSLNTTGLELCIDGIPLTQIGVNFTEKSTKFLGLHIDETLSWRPHLSEINKKISYAIFVIKQVKHILPMDCLKTLYFAIVHPHLTYGILAWGNASSSVLHRTTILQKRAIRTIHRSNYNSHTEPLFKSSGILNVKDLYDFQVALFMHDYVCKKLPSSFDNIFRRNCEVQDSHQTRQSNLLFIEKCNSVFASKQPYFTFPVMWNKWNHIIPDSTSRNKLKSQMKGYLLSNYPNSVKCSNKYCRDCYQD